MITSHLIWTGLTLGVLHVLAGPDHLSALATLSVGGSFKALSLGIRWGLGHSTGLVFVAVIFISLKGDMDLRSIGRFSNIVLGIFMITIGFFGVISALKIFKEKRTKRDFDLNPSTANVKELSLPSLVIHPFPLQKIAIELQQSSKIEQSFDVEESYIESYESGDNHVDKNSIDSYNGHHDHKECWDFFRALSFIDMHDATTQKIVSFLIGVLHGVAGPGAILGVLPAVEMQSWRASSCYLGSFIVASTLSMGAFAALYGEATKLIGSTAESVELGLRVFSSSLSMLVGALWLGLSLLGRLEHFFH
jgi:uncharacterized membrane protein YsdA (DUF1294 family)